MNDSPAAPSLMILLRYRLRMLLHTLRGVRKESRLKMYVVTIVGGIFWIGIFLAFMDSIRFVMQTAGNKLGTSLVHYGLSLFYMALLIMLVFSNALLSFLNLFKSQETTFLFSTPLKRDTIFLYKLIESMVFSSWAVFALGLPLMLALGIQTNASWAFYPLSLLTMVPFVMIPAGLGAILGLLLTAFLPRHRGRVLAVVVLCVLIVGGYAGMTVLGNTSGRNLDAVFYSVMGKLSFSQHFMTPNYWMAEGLLSVAEGHPDCLRTFGILFAAVISTGIFSITLGWFLSGALYSSAFSLSMGMGDKTRRAGHSFLEWLFLPLFRANPATAALMLKDAKTFFRDPAQWSQVLIFFGILLLYSGNLRNLQYPVDLPLYKNLISFLNLGASSMTLATICSRFVFPLISLEGHRFWILGLAPIERRQIMRSKFWFAFCGTSLLSVPLALLSNYVLESGPIVFVVQMLTSLLIALSLSGLSVGMGALFPNFNERNPSKIVSGFGGTLTLILSVGLVAFSVGGGGILCHHFIAMPAINGVKASDNNLTWVVPFVLGLACLNVLAAWLPMRLGTQALEKVEF